MSRKVIFLDTNGWIAILNASDSLHVEADAMWRKLVRDSNSFVLTDWVVAETGNGLARTAARRRFTAAVAMLRADSRTELCRVTDDVLRRALALYDARHDKTWGLVDCASFIVMQDQGIRDAFTNDRHFEQAGFNCLLPLP
jgi:predicted nucleic acid-binding protein